MATKFGFGEIQLGVPLHSTKRRAQPDAEGEFVLAVFGDFSGRANRGVIEPLDQRRVWRVDCDNFQKVSARLGAALRLAGSEHEAKGLELHCESLEDLHPDKLLKKVLPLKSLATARQGLLNPSSASEAARAVENLLSSQPVVCISQEEPAPPRGESDENTLARLLGERRPPSAGMQTQPASAVDRLIRNIVAPSVVPGTSAQTAALLSALDLELTRQLRQILHSPDFQALEAVWRGIDMLVRHFGGEENIKLCLIDISLQEITSDVLVQESLERSSLYRLLQAQTEERPWGAWLGLYSFSAELRQMELLGRLARLAAFIGAPFLAAVSPALVGCASFGLHADPSDWKQALGPEVQAGWQALRELPEAAYAALALPRFLLRQPYGQGSDPIETFPFEELPADNSHESYLWGNPGLLCGWILAEAFREEGWQMQPGGFGEIGELPLHSFKQEDETIVKPCAEAWLSQRAGDAIADKGLVPVMSVKGRNSVRVGPLHSLRSPTAALAGRWGA